MKQFTLFFALLLLTLVLSDHDHQHKRDFGERMDNDRFRHKFEIKKRMERGDHRNRHGDEIRIFKRPWKRGERKFDDHKRHKFEELKHGDEMRKFKRPWRKI